MKLSFITPVAAVAAIALYAQQAMPRMTTVEPGNGKAGDVLTVAGENLDKAAVDNSAQNQRDRDHQTLTPIDQSNKPADLETTRNIRQAIVKDDQLSTEAKNAAWYSSQIPQLR